MSEELRLYIHQKMVEVMDAFDASTSSGRPVMISVRLQRSYEAARKAMENAGSLPNLQGYLTDLVVDIDKLRKHHVELGLVPDAILREIFDPWPGGSDDR